MNQVWVALIPHVSINAEYDPIIDSDIFMHIITLLRT